MLKAYEAIYDQGKNQWLNEAPPDGRYEIIVVADQPESLAVEPEPTTHGVSPPSEMTTQGI